MTGPLTGFLKIPVVTSLPCQVTSLGNPTLTDRIFMILHTSREALGSLALQRQTSCLRIHESGPRGSVPLPQWRAENERSAGRAPSCLPASRPNLNAAAARAATRK